MENCIGIRAFALVPGPLSLLVSGIAMAALAKHPKLRGINDARHRNLQARFQPRCFYLCTI